MQEMQAHAHSFVKKTQGLANALQQQGRTAAAVMRLGSSIALLASLDIIQAASLTPLVQSLVTLRAALWDTCAVRASSKGGSRSERVLLCALAFHSQ